MLTKSILPLPACTDCERSIVTPCAGLYQSASATIPAAGIKAIAIETIKIIAIIRPSLFRSVILAIEDMTLIPTSGTIIINNRFKNI